MNMQFAACLDEMPSLPETTPDLLDDLDSLLASPSAWGVVPASTGQLDLPFNPLSTAPTSDATTSATPESHEPDAAQQHRHMSKEDRKLAMSREVQKRFRARQKAKKQTIETELAATKAELANLRSRQEELQARNALLERMAELNTADDSISSQMVLDETLARRAVSGGPVLTITLWAQHQTLSLDEISNMTPAEFARLWTGYMHKLGEILLSDSYPAKTAEEPLVTTLLEAATLLCCLMAYNVDTTKKVLARRLDNGQPVEGHQLGTAFYTQYLAMANLSEEQIADLMLLRRMCVIRRGQLANQMKAQVALLPMDCFSDMHMPHPTESVIKMHSMAKFIRDNGSEDFRIWGATLCACMRGVFTGAQHAMAHVHAYPCLLSIDHLLDCLAAQQHQPTRQQLLASAHTVDTTAHWENLFMYVNDLREPDYPVYKPFIKSARIQAGALDPGDVSAGSTTLLLHSVE